MRNEFRMPDVGEGLTEAEIVTWNVAVGDTVTVNQILCEIETAKAAVELPSPFAGTVGALLAEPGQTIAVGTPIIAIDTGGDAPAPVTSAAAAAPAEEAGAKIGEAGKDGRIATLVGYGPRPGSVARRPRKGAVQPGSPPAAASVAGTPAPAGTTAPAAGAPAPATAASAVGAPAGATAASAESTGAPAAPAAVAGGAAGAPSPAAADGDAPTGASAPAGVVPLAKPPVRKLARDLGVDLREVVASGATGVITREDVQAHLERAAQPSPAAAAPTPASVGVRREPIRGVRKATAAAMVSSAFTAPHVTEFLTIDITATMELRERLRASREFADVKLTPLAFVAKAICLAARRTPEVNAHWDEAAGEIVYYDRVQLGIAAATPRGLIVPKVRDADTLTLHDLAVALGELTATARAGKTPPADLVGGTITITNVGVFGVDTGTPILNPGEAAILAVGSIKQAPWVVDGELAVRTVCQLALSFDHRLVDGEQGSRFLADVGAVLEDPARALTW